MKKTQFVDAVKNIQKRKASFLSVVLIVALGTGGFFTTRNAYKAFHDATENVYEQGNFKNYELISSGGIVEEDLDRIRKIEGVEEAEGVILLDAELSGNDRFYNVKAISMTDEVSVPLLVEGKMPEKYNELLLNEDVAVESGIKVGDRVNLKCTSALAGDPLKTQSFTVSGIMRHPEYLRYTMVLSVCLPESSFNKEALNDSYTNAFVTGDEEALKGLYEMLPTLSSETKLRIDATAEERIAEKTDEINKQLEEAKEELSSKEAEAEKELADAEKKILNFESIFTDGKRQIEEGRAALAAALAQLTEGEKQLAEGEAQLAKAKKAYAEFEKKLKEFEKRAGVKLTPEQISKYLKSLSTYLNDLEEKMDTGEDSSTEFNLLLNFLSNEEARKALAGLDESEKDSLSRLFDMEKARASGEETKEEVKTVYDDETKTEGIRLVDLFTEEGLLKIYEEEIEDPVKELIDAYNNGGDPEAVKEKLHERLDEENYSKVLKAVDELMLNYIFESMSWYVDDLYNAQGTLQSASKNLNEGLAYINYDSSNVDLDKINATFKELIDKAQAYLDAAKQGKDKEETDALKKELLDYCKNEAVFEMKLINDADWEAEDYEKAIEEAEDPADVLTAFIETANNAWGYNFKVVTDDGEITDELITNEDLSKVIDLLKQIAAMDSADKYDEELVNSFYAARGVDALNTVLYIDHGFDLYMAVAGFNENVESFLQKKKDQFVRLTKDSEDPTKDNEELLNYYSVIKDHLSKIDTAADGIIEAAEKNDPVALIEKLQEQSAATDAEDFYLGKKLCRDLLDVDFDMKASEYLDRSGVKEVSDKADQASKDFELIAKLHSQIVDGERQVEEGRRQLSEGWAAYNAGQIELADKEKLLNASAKQIADARKQLNDARDDAAKKLDEAREEIRTAEREAKEEIDKAREEILSKNYHWLLQDRITNLSYLDVNGTIAGIKGASTAFGALFLLVISLVCFSTIAMIVEEEKKSVGTTKAFGFYNREIFGKYLLFGVLAGVLGCILGVAISYLVTYILMKNMNDQHMYSVGKLPVTSEPLTILITSAFIIGLSVLTTFIACTDLLKTPAAILMKDETLASRERKNKKKETSNRSGRSLYSRLILRNIVNEKERVLITVIIVALSCFIVGIGITLRDSFFGMMVRQKEDVMVYDFRVEYGSKTDDKQIAEIRSILDDNGTEYLDAYYGMHLYDTGLTTNGLYVIAGDKDELSGFVLARDLNTHKPIQVPEEGILIQNRMNERYGIKIGDTMHIYDGDLMLHEADVKGIFTNYQGRYIMISSKAYEKIFGKPMENNCFYVKLNGADYESLQKTLSAVSENITIERSDSYMARLKSSLGLYNTLVIILTFMAILMSFMILTNLSNIFITRKKRELIIMRINGFTIKQTINYLAKETILTTLIGVVLAIILGFFLGRPIVQTFEHTDTMFVRSFDVRAWVIAVALECLFSFLINYFVFQKVKRLNFREI